MSRLDETYGYFENVTIIDASAEKLVEVTVAAWRAISKIDFIYLNGNLLTTLPKEIQQINMSVRSMNLADNSCSCSCADAWIKNWLGSMSDRLMNTDGVQCSSPGRLRGRVIRNIGDEEFCVDPVERLLEEVLIPVGGCLLIFVITILSGVPLQSCSSRHITPSSVRPRRMRRRADVLRRILVVRGKRRRRRQTDSRVSRTARLPDMLSQERHRTRRVHPDVHPLRDREEQMPHLSRVEDFRRKRILSSRVRRRSRSRHTHTETKNHRTENG